MGRRENKKSVCSFVISWLWLSAIDSARRTVATWPCSRTWTRIPYWHGHGPPAGCRGPREAVGDDGFQRLLCRVLGPEAGCRSRVRAVLGRAEMRGNVRIEWFWKVLKRKKTQRNDVISEKIDKIQSFAATFPALFRYKSVRVSQRKTKMTFMRLVFIFSLLISLSAKPFQFWSRSKTTAGKIAERECKHVRSSNFSAVRCSGELFFREIWPRFLGFPNGFPRKKGGRGKCALLTNVQWSTFSMLISWNQEAIDKKNGGIEERMDSCVVMHCKEKSR